MSRTHSRILTVGRLLSISTAIATLLLCGGCLLPGEGSRQLTFEPESRKIQYLYDFDRAYAAPSADGGYDLVLTSGFKVRSARSGERLYPAAVPATGQVLHVHVSWRPSRGSKSDHPAATNSTLRWHLFRGDPATTQDRIVYSGVGFVSVEVDEEETLFDLRDVRVKPHHIQGAMRDPLGPSRVSGPIRAQNNAPAVAEILRRLEADLQSSAAPADQH